MTNVSVTEHVNAPAERVWEIMGEQKTGTATDCANVPMRPGTLKSKMNC